METWQWFLEEIYSNFPINQVEIFSAGIRYAGLRTGEE